MRGIIMLEFIRNITSRRNDDGASAVEYGLLVAGIAALIVAVVFIFGGVIKGAFSHTCGQVSSGVAGTYNAAATC
jgi:pilus assembly protein Flp/PilA